ncbi:hypothetical protein DXG01_002860 [Tephrocybe rancida]|nr:hypothetical protein DXG01_002860 [Tephrocybe rancida]
MANYLPVLLVSVAANFVPDDSSVSTLPRGQVDYLSHNWEEEDVWRSWRNMTRQKNEIANGVRLENASWRTWWKQRNGLGTVTPETLNWLKDSDVTWLYGPLHTAVDWVPPKPIEHTGHSALDLSIPTHKPILKHRSISQLLTSDLPTSPIFSPPESDDEEDHRQSHFSHPLPQLPDEPGGSPKPHHARPTLSHTKSDTHITRWGPNRAFRKASPPRIDPPAHLPSAPGDYSPTNLEGYFSNSNQSSDGTTPAVSNNNGNKKRHISFNTFVEQCIAIEKPKKRAGYAEDDEDDDEDDEEGEGDGDDYLHHNVAGRYPYGRNAWGYDDGYEEDAEESEDDAEAVSLSMWDERFSGSRALSGSDSDSYEDGIGEEDGQAEEDEGDGVIELRSSLSTRSISTSSPRSQSTASSSSSASTSTSVSNNSTSSASGSGSPDGRKRRLSTSTTSTYRPQLSSRSGSGSGSGSGTSRKRRAAPPLIRTSSDRPSSPPQPTHVTIAPIAPTILKTGPNAYYGYGGQHPGGWSEGFGDEGGSDDGMWGGAAGGGASKWWGTGGGKSKGKAEESDGSGGQTPVELVYVPPLGSNYSLKPNREREREKEQRIFVRERERNRDRAAGEKVVISDVMEDHEDGFGNGDQDVYRRRATLFSVGNDDADADADDTEPTFTTRGVHLGAPVPTVVVRHETHPDIGNDFQSRRSSSSSLNQGQAASIVPPRGRGASSTPAARAEAFNERSRSKSHSRSRSRSRSRTPSPAMITASTSIPSTSSPPSTSSSSNPAAGPGHTHGPVIILSRRSSSTSPPQASSSLLSPPPRGRGSQSYQDVAQAGQRGRSSTRTASSASDRERSTGTHSLGSLSPEGLDLGGVAGAYTGGWYERDSKRGDRDGRDAKIERERSRGREKVESRRFSGQGQLQTQSVSPEGVQDSLLRVSPATTAPVIHPAPSRPDLAPRPGVGSKNKAPASSISSSSSSRSTSSSTTVVPSTAPEPQPIPHPIPVAVSIDVRKAEEHQRHLQPTPSNSPIIHMRPVRAAAATEEAPSTLHPTPTTTYTPKAKSPLVLPAVHPAEPSTSYSISPPRGDLSPPSSPRSPSSGEPTIVGKAVEIVSSAGAFLGFWNNAA